MSVWSWALPAAALLAVLTLVLRGSLRRVAAGALAAVLLAAAVSAVPVRRTAEVRAAFSGGDQLCTLEVLEVSGSRVTARAELLKDAEFGCFSVTFFDDFGLLPGDRLTAQVSLRNTEAQSAVENFRCSIQPRSLLPPGRGLHADLHRLKSRFAAACAALLGGGEGALSASVVTGDLSPLPQELKREIQRAGMGDLLAVSGMHVGLVLGLLGKPFRQRGWLRMAVSLTAGVLLSVFYLGSGSVLRAVLMQLLGILGTLLNLRTDPLTALGAVVLLLTAINPFFTQELSFLMSVCCCLGLFLSVDSIRAVTARLITRFGRLGRLLAAAAENLLVSLAVGVALLPCLLWAGIPVSLTAPFSAVLTSFVMLPHLVCSALAGAFQMWIPFSLPARAFGLAAGLLSRYIMAVAELFSRLPFASVLVQGEWLPMAALFAVFSLVLVICGVVRLRIVAAVCLLVLSFGSFGRRSALYDSVAVVGLPGGTAFVQGQQAVLLVEARTEGEATELWQQFNTLCLPAPSCVIMERDTPRSRNALRELFPSAALRSRESCAVMPVFGLMLELSPPQLCLKTPQGTLLLTEEELPREGQSRYFLPSHTERRTAP